MTEDLVKRLLDVAAATGPNEARQIALAAADRIKELEDKLVKPFAWITSETSDWLKGYDGPACAKATAIHRVPPKSGTSVPVYSVPPSIRPEADVRAEAWAAAIDAAKCRAVDRWSARREHADKLYEMDYPQAAIDAKMVGAKADEAEMIASEIISINPPADISAALDRIKAEAKAEGMREALKAAKRSREAVIHSGQRDYIAGIARGHDRAEAAILAAIPQTTSTASETDNKGEMK